MTFPLFCEFNRNFRSRRVHASACIGSLAVALGLAACQTVTPPAPVPIEISPVTAPTPTAPTAALPQFLPVAWSTLPGWSEDDITRAWPAFLQTCRALAARPAWKDVCGAARQLPATDSTVLRNFFESRFTAYGLRSTVGNDSGLVTGYYEPLLHGSRTMRAPYLTPLYGVPADLVDVELSEVYPQLKGMRLRGKIEGRKLVPYGSREDLDDSGALKGNELVWVQDPLEAMFLEIQGSGRVVFDDGPDSGQTVRLAYADQNGYPYKSIGRWLVDRGELTLDAASMQGIQKWARAHPDQLPALLHANPSYVFFREAPIADPNVGPNGALGVPLTPERSVAVDPKVVPIGVPVFLATTEPNSDIPLTRLTMAQDTGGAIYARGGSVVRIDYFWGFGAEAGQKAGRMKQEGKVWILLPNGVPPPHPAQ